MDAILAPDALARLTSFVDVSKHFSSALWQKERKAMTTGSRSRSLLRNSTRRPCRLPKQSTVLQLGSFLI